MQAISINCLSKNASNIHKKTAVVRVDYNVPYKDGQILDDTRIRSSLPTINFLLKNQCGIRLLTHFGRPKGMRMEYSTKFLQGPLSQLLKKPVVFCSDWILQNDEIVLYENLRFTDWEEKNDPVFSQKLAGLGDFYVNDAFSVSHRSHASVEGITHYTPSYAGLALEKEIIGLEVALKTPQKPVLAIIGGSKISTKINVLKNLLKIVDFCFVGGSMANTFLKAQKIDIGKSLVEDDFIPVASSLLEEFANKIILPEDYITTDNPKTPTNNRIVLKSEHVGQGAVVDIGPRTINKIISVLDLCSTVVWNGPLGILEISPFDHGTIAIMKHVGSLSQKRKIFSVVGGGETVSAVHMAHQENNINFTSTAGGAFLEWLEGKDLPGIVCLQKQSGV